MLKVLCSLGFGLLTCIYAQAEPPERCQLDQAHILVSLNELPQQVQTLLGRATVGTSGIADINEKFNPSDVIIDPSIPMRRFVRGLFSPTCIRLTVEHGGRANYTEQLEFKLTEHGWTKLGLVER